MKQCTMAKVGRMANFEINEDMNTCSSTTTNNGTKKKKKKKKKNLGRQ